MKIVNEYYWWNVKGYLDNEMKRVLALKDRPKEK